MLSNAVNMLSARVPAADAPPPRGAEERHHHHHDDKKYVQLGPETVVNAAESIGITGVPADAAKALAEDASYRLREVADMCAQFLRHSRKRRLTTDLVNKALKVKRAEPVLGYKLAGSGGGLERLFVAVPGEGDMYVERSDSIDLVRCSLTAEEALNRDHSMAVSANWLSLQG